MKHPLKRILNVIVVPALVMASSAAIVSGCSTIQGGKSGQEVSAKGPTVLEAKTEPSTFELDSNLRPKQQPEIFADVKDFTSPISSVRARFVHVPIEVQMKRLAGTTWHATLTQQQLKQLAVSGQTMRYDVNIVATNEKGESATTREPVQVAVKAPEPTELTG